MRKYRAGDICLLSNRKTQEVGTIDVKRGCVGCELAKAPCYASKMAQITAINFFAPVTMTLNRRKIERQLSLYSENWVRIGCSSEPSLDWKKTIEVCNLIRESNKTPVIISKGFNVLTKEIASSLVESSPIVQISVSAFQSKAQEQKRFKSLIASREAGLKTSLRIVSCMPKKKEIIDYQEKLISFARKENFIIIDTPLRLFTTSPLYKKVDTTKYFRHHSPLSGKLDNQYTAGLIIEKSFPCFSSCSRLPRKEFQDPGCDHQCLTETDVNTVDQCSN